MQIEPTILTLTPPRYMRIAIEGTPLAVWYDKREDKYEALCPACHRLITCDTLHIVYREMLQSERQCCQGCRARISLEYDPGLIWMFLDFWSGTGAFPQSPSWLEAIPQHQSNVWAKEIEAGLEAATAPLMEIQPVPLGIALDT